MKQLSLLFFTFFLTAFCNAQKTDIQYGPFSKDIIIMDPVIGVTPQSIYTSHHSSLYNSFTLSKFSNKTLELLSDLYIDEPKIDKQFINYDTILIYKGKPVLFASKYYSKTKVHNAYAFVINENGVLDSAKLITTESIKSKKKLGEYEYKLSEDGNKIIQYYCYKFPKVKMDSTLLSVKVMDRDLNEIWKKQFNFPYDNSRCDISPPLLDTKNNLYFHMRLTLRNKDNVSQINELLHYRKDNDETKHIPLNIENNFFKSYSVKLNKEDRIVVLVPIQKTLLRF